MTSLPKIELRGAGKRYTKYEDRVTTSGVGGLRRRTRKSALWALRDIDLAVEAGECFGVIGRNGGGKTTMLQVLAGVTAPSEGTVTVRGTVAPLMAVGVGFHPELTGRENVHLNATILGRTRQEIDDSFDAVVEFAEIGDYIDTPTKFYSSGMLVRLGFSVAIRSEPDVLLLDEVLAVGDVAFQAKCFDRINEIRQGGATVVIVSHNLHAVRLLCDRVLVLDRGRQAFLGSAHDAISVYHELLHEERDPEDAGTHAAGADAVVLQRLALVEDDGEATAHLVAGQEALVAVDVSGPPGRKPPRVDLAVASATGQLVYREGWEPPAPFDDDGRCDLLVRFTTALPSGTFTLEAVLHDTDTGEVVGSAGPLSFFVSGRLGVQGVVDLEPSYRSG